MPELPEVETIARGLKDIEGFIIIDFTTLFPKAIKLDFKKFKKAVAGKRINSVGRTGKYIKFELDSKGIILFHLRMTGALEIKAVPKRTEHASFLIRADDDRFSPRARYVRHRFLLEGPRSMVFLDFNDIRKFGTIEYVSGKDLPVFLDVKKIGIDPLSKSFNLKYLKDALKNRVRKNLKSFLLSQSDISGIGNIYASEILHEAMLRPDRNCASLSDIEMKALYHSIRSVLSQAVRHRGTSISDYRDARGTKGNYQNHLKVYGKKDEHCLRNDCRGNIERKVDAQRSTFFCPRCQK